MTRSATTATRFNGTDVVLENVGGIDGPPPLVMTRRSPISDPVLSGGQFNHLADVLCERSVEWPAMDAVPSVGVMAFVEVRDVVGEAASVLFWHGASKLGVPSDQSHRAGHRTKHSVDIKAQRAREENTNEVRVHRRSVNNEPSNDIGRHDLADVHPANVEPAELLHRPLKIVIWQSPYDFGQTEYDGRD